MSRPTLTLIAVIGLFAGFASAQTPAMEKLIASAINLRSQRDVLFNEVTLLLKAHEACRTGDKAADLKFLLQAQEDDKKFQKLVSDMEKLK